MTTRRKITLRNDFHQTEATVIAIDNIVSARAMRRAENKLCGISDCRCGGLRGPQDICLEPLNYEGDMRVVAKPNEY